MKLTRSKIIGIGLGAAAVVAAATGLILISTDGSHDAASNCSSGFGTCSTISTTTGGQKLAVIVGNGGTPSGSGCSASCPTSDTTVWTDGGFTHTVRIPALSDCSAGLGGLC